MIGDLSNIIDSLYQEKEFRNGIFELFRKKNNKKIIFIIGAGFEPINNILNDSDLEKKINNNGWLIKKGTKKFKNFKWRHFEAARYFTNYNEPSFAHYCIYQLVKDGLCRDIITTNYDLYFDSLWEKIPDFKIKRNPVCDNENYLWEDYYSCMDSSDEQPRYWKIHGSLSHVVFRGKNISFPPLLFKLPRFPISSNFPEIVRIFPTIDPIPFMRYEEVNYPKSKFTKNEYLERNFEPYIDWTFNNDRRYFKDEIDAVKRILTDTNRIAAIVLIGFTGYYNNKNKKHPWNEDLVPILNDLLINGSTPMFMAIHNQQWLKNKKRIGYDFMRRMDQKHQCFRFASAVQFIDNVLHPLYSKKFAYDDVLADYRSICEYFRKDLEPSYVN